MANICVGVDELTEVLQYINLIRLQIDEVDNWHILPILYSNENLVEVVISENKKDCGFDKEKLVVFKFQREGYEYIVDGKITNINNSNDLSTMEIAIDKVQKYYNKRKYMRFETELQISIDKDVSKEPEKFKQDDNSLVRNISYGGVLAFSNVEYVEGSTINVLIYLKSGNLFQTKTKVIRANKGRDGKFSYGLQFVDTDTPNKKILEKEITLLEEEYLDSLDSMRVHNKGNDTYKTKIAIFTNQQEKSLEIREALKKQGASNFVLYSDFAFYSDLFEIEQAKIVIIDSVTLDNEVIKFINMARENLKDVTEIILLPMEFSEDIRIDEIKREETVFMFKPLIFNEFEEEIIKYL